MKRNPMKIVVIAVSFLMILSGSSVAADNVRESAVIWNHENDGCNPGLYKQPNGPMAIMVFCEHALGIYIGLVYYDNKALSPMNFTKNYRRQRKRPTRHGRSIIGCGRLRYGQPM